MGRKRFTLGDEWTTMTIVFPRELNCFVQSFILEDMPIIVIDNETKNMHSFQTHKLLNVLLM